MGSTHPLNLDESPDKLFDAVCAFGASLETDDVAREIARQICDIAPVITAAVYRWDAALETLTLLVQAHDDEATWARDLLSARADVLMRVLEAGEIVHAQPHNGAMPAALALPLQAGGQMVGILAVWPRAEFSAEDHVNLARLLPPAAASLHNALVFSETYSSLRDRVIEVSTIEVVSRHISATLDLQVITSDVLAAAMSAIDAARGQCAMAAGEDHFLVVAQFDEHGTAMDPEQSLRDDDGVVLEVLRTCRPVLVPYVAENDKARADLMPDTRSALCVPITREGKSIGTLSFEDPRPGAFNEAHVRFVTTLAEHAAIAIENARLFEDRQRQIDTLLALRQLSLKLLSTLELACVVDTLVEHAQRMVHAREVRLYLVDDDGVAALAAERLADPHRVPGAPVPPERYAAVSQVAASGQRYASLELPPQTGFRLLPAGSSEAVVAVPVNWASQVIGVLEVVLADPQHYTHYALQALDLLANQAAVAIENTRLYEEVSGARDQLQLILDSTHEAMFLFDGHARLLRFNPIAEELVGHPLHLWLGRDLSQWLITLGGQRLKKLAGFTIPELREYIQCVRDDHAHPTRRQFEQRYEGGTRHISETGTPVLDENGELAGWLLVWRDTTEEHNLELLRQELSGMIVHDLRNPISSISNSLDMLHEWWLEGEDDTAMVTEVISIAQDSARSMLNLVQSLLDIARLEQDQMVLSRDGHDVNALIDATLAAMLGIITASSVRVEVETPDDLPPVWADAEKIQRVLVNLLDNALRYTPMQGAIRIIAQQDGQMVRVSVEDDGPGVPPEARVRIFDKYAQLDNKAQRGQKGSGIGLAFCRLAVEAHGGHIWIEDGRDGGAAFIFTLPAAEPAPSDPSQ